MVYMMTDFRKQISFFSFQIQTRTDVHGDPFLITRTFFQTLWVQLGGGRDRKGQWWEGAIWSLWFKNVWKQRQHLRMSNITDGPTDRRDVVTITYTNLLLRHWLPANELNDRLTDLYHFLHIIAIWNHVLPAGVFPTKSWMKTLISVLYIMETYERTNLVRFSIMI